MQIISISIGHVMNKNVTLIHPDKSIRYAGQILKAVDIGCLVVMDHERISGILTERDIVQKAVSSGLDANNVRVKDVMSSNVITIDSKESVEEAVDIMEKKRIKKIPVVDNGKLVGIVTMTDLLGVLRKLESDETENI